VSIGTHEPPIKQPAGHLGERVSTLPWAALTEDLDARGVARLPALLTPDECAALVALYADTARFRSARQGVGHSAPVSIQA